MDFQTEPPAPRTSTTLSIRVKFPDAQHDVVAGLGDLANRDEPLPTKLTPPVVSRVRFFLCGPPVIEGFGLPFSNPGHPSEQWLFNDIPIIGNVTLSSILAQQEFEFIVPRVGSNILEKQLSSEALGADVKYPYGPQQAWDLSVGNAITGVIAGPHFPPAFSFPDDESCVAVLAQSVFQDYFWLQQAADAIKETWFSVYFVGQGDDDSSSLATSYFVVVHLPDAYQDGHEDAWRSFLKGASLQLEIDGVNGNPWSARVLEAPQGFGQLHPHGAKDNDRLFLLARKPKKEEFVGRQFESGAAARDALKQGSDL